jgi:hypothetical protein
MPDMEVVRLMKRLVMCLLIAVGTMAAQSGCCDATSGYQLYVAGPELTGNYANPYLYSPTTGRTYADPMFYHAQSALRRWHQIRSEGIPAPAVSKQYIEVKAESR